MENNKDNGFCGGHAENCSNIARLETKMDKADKEIGLNCRFIKDLQKEKVDKMAFYKAIGAFILVMLASFSFTFGVHMYGNNALKTHVALAMAQCGDVQKRQSALESENNLSTFMYKSFGDKLDKIYDQNTKVIFKIEDLDRRVYRLELEKDTPRGNDRDARDK